MKKQTGILVGAGSRGTGYSKIMNKLPDKFDIVGVAEPIENRRDFIKDLFNIDDSKCFENWQDIFAQGKIADFAIIATQDNMHVEPALKAIELGYNLLLEKPIAPTPEECKMVADAAEKKGVKVVVCHVLRYTNIFSTLKDVIASGEIGEVMSIEALESVGTRHMSHSYVRGNWRNEGESSPMLLAKCCHDIDLIQWLIGKECTKVQSFGSLNIFKKENKPEGSPERCIDGCPYADTCIYDTKKLYQGEHCFGGDWFKRAATRKMNPTEEDVEKALREGQYGRCVYNCDNDVVDHQVVNLEFEGGITASLTMTAFTKDSNGREMKVFGTKGMLEVIGDNKYINVTHFGQLSKEYWGDRIDNTIDVSRAEDDKGIGITTGHGGGDLGIVLAIYDEFNDAYKGKSISTVRESYLNHAICFAAEESRHNDTVVRMKEYDAKIK